VGDTVGFLRKLPHSLVASFRSTLREVEEADLVVHVVDASSPAADEQRQVAEEVLADLGVTAERILLVYNKVDAVPEGTGSLTGLPVSAKTGLGLADLRAAVVSRLETLGVPVPAPSFPTDVQP
jgi:GTP-binding protein HflX